MSHDFKATSMIGQGNVHLNDTSRQHERSVIIGVAYTKYTADLTATVDTLELVDPLEPPAPDPGDQVAFECWKYVYKEYMIKMQKYTNFHSGLYSLVMGQCTNSLKERLKSHEDFVGANQNGIALSVLIRSLLNTFEERCKLADCWDGTTRGSRYRQFAGVNKRRNWCIECGV